MAMHIGKLKWFNKVNGFGFVNSEAFPGVDIMIHAKGFSRILRIPSGFRPIAYEPAVEAQDRMWDLDKGQVTQTIEIAFTDPETGPRGSLSQWWGVIPALTDGPVAVVPHLACILKVLHYERGIAFAYHPDGGANILLLIKKFSLITVVDGVYKAIPYPSKGERSLGLRSLHENSRLIAINVAETDRGRRCDYWGLAPQ